MSTLRAFETPQPRYRVEAEGTTGNEYYEGSKGAYDEVAGLDESSDSHIRRLRCGYAESERVQVIEIRTDAPLDKISKFEVSVIGQTMHYTRSNDFSQ